MKSRLLPTAFACAALLSGCGLDVMYADWKVDQLCKKDGGVKVFVTDAPPAEFRKADGNIDLEALQRAKPGQTYYLARDWTPIRQTEPEITRLEMRLVRHRDDALLGTSVVYIRPTQSIGVPLFHREGYSCPEPGDLQRLIEGVFFATTGSK